MKKKSNPEGRPTLYKPEYCQLIVDHMKEGNSVTSFAALVGVVKDTIYEWFKRYPEFADAFKKAKELEELWYEKAGKASMVGKIPNFNSAVYIFHMKNKFGWRDRPDDIKITHVLEEQKQLDKIDPNVIEGILLGREDEDDD
jgi:hypothetical protein